MIAQNLQKIKSNLPSNVTLVAVSKTKPIKDILTAYQAGQRVFGENKVQEMVGKFETLPQDIEWHMIGHLQRNKVKYMAHFVSLIHGVDSLKTLQEINKQAQKHHRVINCLLQIKIAKEDTKFGLLPKDAHALFLSNELVALKNIKVTGLMGMATFTDDMNQVKDEFKLLKTTFNTLKTIQVPNCKLETLSMGMSDDYKIAIQEGSTMVRVGSSIFGARI